jgi:hypothetical protein
VDRNHHQDLQYARGGGLGGLGYNVGNAPVEKVTVTRSQLQSAMKSKLDLYNILTKEGQLYLPPLNECTMYFIKELLTGKKKVSTHSLKVTL